MVEATNICGNCKYYKSTDLWYLGFCRKLQTIKFIKLFP
uniref:High potential iron-sulfur protein like n=1 Tax=Siphoviridae sp. ctnPP24 TaxID=2825662 RepID=A0A8S5TYZ0_9CAUD|nr:MAG TPA: High potential iron-sulfur protein like [Siphoviridae sp. ctnPP24]